MKKNRYILDTNILIELIRENPVVLECLRKVGTENCCMSVISSHELHYGAYHAPYHYQKQELIRIRKVMRHFPVIPLPEDGSDFGRIKANLIKRGLIIDDFDISIAGTAMKEGMIIVTDNIRHFARIEGLHVENWTS
ncbi:MAG: PIN domain-containing protein [Bacteroidaceae bacterium]|nr:PIN domain-containing protein [Bacteroidaceae bacterium]